jgi:hypothetical protein
MSEQNIINVINTIIKNKNKTSLIVFKIPKNYNINKFLYHLEQNKITVVKMYKHNSNHILCNIIFLEL